MKNMTENWFLTTKQSCNIYKLKSKISFDGGKNQGDFELVYHTVLVINIYVHALVCMAKVHVSLCTLIRQSRDGFWMYWRGKYQI